MRGVRKILIALNGSKEVLNQGLKLASDEGGWVTVVKVIPPNEGELDLTCIKNIEDVLNSSVSGEINKIEDAAARERMIVKARVEEAEPHDGILDAAKQERCDLIVMGAKKSGLFGRLFGDNTVEKVLRHAPCPVLVVGG